MRLLAKIATVLLTVLAIIKINISYAPTRSDLQVKFDTWLGNLEQQSLAVQKLRAHTVTSNDKLAAGTSVDPLTQVELSVSSPNHGINWKVSAAQEVIPSNLKTDLGDETLVSSRSKLQRLLSLIREANLFSLSDATSNLNNDVSVKIITPDQSFSSEISARKISESATATLLFKLFQIYSNDQIAFAKTNNSNEVKNE